jgi:hypothetical protein
MSVFEPKVRTLDGRTVLVLWAAAVKAAEHNLLSEKEIAELNSAISNVKYVLEKVNFLLEDSD